MKTFDYVMSFIIVAMGMFSIFTLGTWVDAKFANVEGNITKGYCHCVENKKG